MKRLVLFALMLLCATSYSSAQHKKTMVDIPREKLAANAFPLVSIHDLQFQPYDSLHYCDSIVSRSGPASSSAAWLAQTSPYYKGHIAGGVVDTVEIVGQIIVPPKIITFTGYGAYNFTLRDTGITGSGAWHSIFVRVAGNADTLALYNAGILTYNPGDIIRLRGYADEYPTSNFVSYTEFVPIADGFIADPSRSPMDQCVDYVGTAPLPPPDVVTAGQFMKGVYTSSGTNIQFATGEQWEDCYVELTNLTVTEKVNSTNGTVGLVDQLGNEISTMDGSKWFTTRAGSPSTSTIPYRDPSSTYTIPSVGQVIDTIRGYIATNSGSDAPRGYRIYPVFQGDMVLGSVLLLPSISTHRRNPIALKSTDSAIVTVKAYQQIGGANIKSVNLKYSLNNGSWVQVAMTGPAPADSSWQGVIPKQSANTFVKYFCSVTDSLDRSVLYASAAGGSVWQDSSQGFFFYTVLDRPLTISDIQYSPFPTGLSGIIGDTATVNGVVTADTSSINVNSSGALPLYIQDGNAPWSGLWIAPATGDAALYNIHNGDSVRVSGIVQEYSVGLAGQVGRITRLGNTIVVSKFSSGHALPEPVVLSTGAFNVGNGDPGAEPYEDMVVRFNNVSVVDTAPTYSDPSEYSVTDGSGPIIVRSQDSNNKYSLIAGDDTLYGKTVLRKGDSLSYIQGIIYFSYNQYKLVPRGNSDFGTYKSVVTSVAQTPFVPLKFGLSQNYPNPFNPSTRIEFDIPSSGSVTLKIYNMLGQEVASLLSGYRNAGHYVVQFDAARLSSGMYIYRLQSPSGMAAKKMLLIK
jgi:hypothetical protein